MNKSKDYRFYCKIVDEDTGEVIASGNTYIIATNISQIGDEPNAEGEVARMLRSFKKEWLKEMDSTEEEIPEELDYTGAGDPLDNNR